MPRVSARVIRNQTAVTLSGRHKVGRRRKPGSDISPLLAPWHLLPLPCLFSTLHNVPLSQQVTFLSSRHSDLTVTLSRTEAFPVLTIWRMISEAGRDAPWHALIQNQNHILTGRSHKGVAILVTLKNGPISPRRLASHTTSALRSSVPLFMLFPFGASARSLIFQYH